MARTTRQPRRRMAPIRATATATATAATAATGAHTLAADLASSDEGARLPRVRSPKNPPAQAICLRPELNRGGPSPPTPASEKPRPHRPGSMSSAPQVAASSGRVIRIAARPRQSCQRGRWLLRTRRGRAPDDDAFHAPLLDRPNISDEDAVSRSVSLLNTLILTPFNLIPNPNNYNLCAHCRNPMDMMRHG
jgi:hypothetical protein